MENFMVLAMLGGAGVAIISSIVGNFILWKKMAYFGDSLAHAAFLGITIALFFEINPLLGAVIIAIIFSFVLLILKNKFESDTILGILAHSSISIAIIWISFMENVRVDLMGYLFGDILTITYDELKIIYVLCFLTITWIFINWKSLLIRCIDKDLAKSQNVNTKSLDLYFTILIAMIVVVSVKIVGIILITALLIIPAATARNMSRSPLQMVIFSVVIGIVSVSLGLYSSLILNSPSGPSIIVANLLLFILSLGLGTIVGRRV